MKNIRTLDQLKKGSIMIMRNMGFVVVTESDTLFIVTHLLKLKTNNLFADGLWGPLDNRTIFSHDICCDEFVF